MASWDQMGELANVAQLTGVDAVKLIGMIVRAASTARMHKKNCRQFAQHLKLIGNLLEQLKISELKRYPETREPLEQLEDALRRSYILVNSCQDRSYLYLLAMGWNIVYQFRKAQNEIDRYLRLVPLITLVDNARVRERLEVIEMDQREYTLDDDDQKAQTVIFKPEPDIDDTAVLKKTLSCSYPNCSFTEALKKENEKLKLELQRSQANLDMNQCQVIQRLLDVTEVAAYSVPEKCSPEKNHKKEEYNYSKDHSDNEHSSDEKHHAKEVNLVLTTLKVSASSIPSLYSSHMLSTHQLGVHIRKKIGTLIYLLVVPSLHSPYQRMVMPLLAHFQYVSATSLLGGFIDDFLSHLMCCCCALVQEWREVEIRGIIGMSS
ncbi:hypothetical protein V8G54_017708 [Vigna mungo]|uniref:MCAfunc domain-containing protein n=1 Tax=Vigna mungo TaxID=3915 RepID=A0AAQ3NRD0_VIGMU